MSDHHKQVNPYLAQKVMTASPEQLIAYIFDVGVAACARGDREKACKAVQELINALNFEHQAIATSFYQLYRYVLNAIHRGEFQNAREILVGLKAAWAEAMNVS
jgi:flagellar protein FliS